MEWNLVLVDLTTAATPHALRPGPFMQGFIDAGGWLVDIFSKEVMGMNVHYRIAPSPGDRKAGEVAVNFRDTIPEAPDAMAYHTDLFGVPDIEIGVDLYKSISADGDGVSVGWTHELLEMLRSPGANGWRDKGNGTMSADESCDVVQNEFFAAANGYAVSDFLLESYFIPGAKGPWDYRSVLANPSDMSHGYEIRAVSPTHITQVPMAKLVAAGGVHYEGSLTPLQLQRKRHTFSRTKRRGLHL